MSDETPRFRFGANWNHFVRRKHSRQRLDAAAQRLTAFLGRGNLQGSAMLDIGCGSGLHAMAAVELGAACVHSFDYDPDAVQAARLLWENAGRPAQWTIERGDVLDAAYMDGLGVWPLVYCWGVLHHTGRMWDALTQAQARVAPGGLFYLALYSSDAGIQPSKEFWLDVKQRYNRAGAFRRWLMMWWYVWRFGLGGNPRNIPAWLRQVWTPRVHRGMNYFTDVRDWIGGWPMEYAGDQETVDLLEEQHGFELMKVATGQACTEFLFRRTGIMGRKTDVTALVARLKAEGAYSTA